MFERQPPEAMTVNSEAPRRVGLSPVYPIKFFQCFIKPHC
jgi:hypothetical protein